MEIALATNGLVGIGGSETYLLTVAEHLRRLGHGVVVHAEEGGAMSELMEDRGLRVEIGERGLPEACDAVLVQDAAMAYALADRWPGAPQVFRAPSALYDFQSPPQLPGVVAAVVVCSDRMARHVEAMAGEREIVRLRQPIDIKRLCPRGEIRERPRRALLLVIEEGVFCGPRLIVTNDPAMGRQGPGVVHPVTTLRRACRIAANVTLLPGLEIGEDALVGAGSLVTRSVPPRTVVVGSPARVVVRELRDDELNPQPGIRPARLTPG
jgi:hypothetical protein